MSRMQTAADLMSPHILTVADDMTTDDLARYLIEQGISGAPVVDTNGHLVGVVSMTDLGRDRADAVSLASPRQSDFYRDEPPELTLEDFGQRYIEERALAVRDVMTPVVYEVPLTAPATEVARIMVAQHVHRLVVTDGKEPAGIITSLDVLRMIADAS